MASSGSADSQNRVSPKVAEYRRNQCTVAAQQRLVATRDDCVGDLRREEAAQAPQPVEFLDLRRHPRLELAVPACKLGGLGLNLVVQGLDAQQRAHPREQLGLVDGLGEKIVGTRFQTLNALLVRIERRDQDHRQCRGRGIGAQLLANLVAAHPRHHDVQEHQIRMPVGHFREPFLARARCLDGIAAHLEQVVQELHVHRRVIDHEDPRRVAHVGVPRESTSSTAAMNSLSRMGLGW